MRCVHGNIVVMFHGANNITNSFGCDTATTLRCCCTIATYGVSDSVATLQALCNDVASHSAATLQSLLCATLQQQCNTQDLVLLLQCVPVVLQQHRKSLLVHCCHNIASAFTQCCSSSVTMMPKNIVVMHCGNIAAWQPSCIAAMSPSNIAATVQSLVCAALCNIASHSV